MRTWLLALFLSFLVLSAPGCAEFRPSWLSEDYFAEEELIDGPRNGHFEGDEWIPDDPTIAATYRIPDIGAGFVFDARTLDVVPSIQIELLEFDIPFLPYLRTWKLDGGVAYQRAYGYFGPLITNIFEISIGGFCGWNWEDGDLSYGVGFSIIKF